MIRERTPQVSYNFAPAGEASGSGTGPSIAFGSGAIDPAESGPAESGPAESGPAESGPAGFGPIDPRLTSSGPAAVTPIDPSLTSEPGPAASVPALSGFSASGDDGSDAGGGLELDLGGGFDPDLASRSPSPDYPPEHPTTTLGNFRGIFEVPESPTGPATPNVGGAEFGRSPSPIRPLGSPSFRATPTPLGGIARGTAPALQSPSLGALGVSGRSRRIRSFASPSLASRVADQDTTMQDTFPSDNAAQHTQLPAQETSVVWTRVPPDQRCTWIHRQVAVLPGAPDDEEEEEDTSKLNNAASRAPGLIFK
ncbi:hypothetical protein FALBO_654 [Fusarium albosuccineum]|uniref:Uncharacterized protein n=1 Tax=Fusarium albosuccineum TaxID=1237068 RepID=A0A8H4LQ30_9HYPO|nr:hypothetical protein FALBO_654 [Fusarium albosuccineum]